MDLDDFEVVQRFFAPTYLDNPILVTGRDTVLAAWVKLAQCSSSYEQEAFLATLPYRVREFLRRTGREQKIGKPLLGLNPEEYRAFLDDIPAHSAGQEQEVRSCVQEHMMHVLSALEEKAGSLQTIRPRFASPLGEQGALWWSRWSSLDEAVSRIAEKMANGLQEVVWFSWGTGTLVACASYVALLSCTSDGDLLLTWEQFLMFKDLCFSRFQVHAARLWLYPDSPSLDTLLARQYTWQMQCLETYGNKGYEVAKCTEELSKAYLSYITDPIFGASGPYPRFLEKVRSKEVGLGGTAPWMADAYDAILRDTTSISDVVELFGVQKLCGHPLIDPVQGGLSAAAEARARDATTYQDAQRIRNNFCRIYLQAYVTKHAKWPPLKFQPLPPVHKRGGKTYTPITTLQRLSNIQFRHLVLDSYPLSDWNTCSFEQHQEFDYHDNFLDLMDDKSISYYRSQKHATWDRGVRVTSNKRLLLEMIAREEISPRTVVDRVMRREIPLDWFIVSLYPKEREFKLAARMFSMLVFEVRLYFALTESNLADSIFPYLPQQTMTKDKVSVLRMFGDITKPITSGGRVRFFIEADLSRWNLRWRSLTVHMVGDVIDDIFGLRGVFTFVHEFFAKCLILVRTPDIRPPHVEQETPPESDTLWYNHVGGFEGITQKLWSVCTYSMVDLALHGFPVSYVLLGQGDNQILAITVEILPGLSAQQTAAKYCKDIMKRLDEECKKTNQNLKPEECLESGSVLTYSKDVYVNGVDYHTSLKAHSRMFPHSSSDFPSVATDVGAVFAAGLAGAERTRFPLGSYALAYYHSLMYLVRSTRGSGIYGQYLKKKWGFREGFLERLQYLLWLPSEMGGLSVQGPAAFLYKGGSDPLSRSLASVHLLGTKYPHHSIYGAVLREAQEGAFLNPLPRMSALIKDPYGLPIMKPATPADRVASATLQALRPSVRNRDLSEIMSTDCEEFGNALIDHLSRMVPFNPLVAHDLYDCSVAGIVDTLSRLLTSTRTIQTFVRRGQSPIVEKLLSQEHATWDYLHDRWKERARVTPVSGLSIFAMCTRLRSAWKRNGGKEPVGVTTYHPLDFPVIWGPPALTETGISALVQAENGNPLYTRGPHDPYLGSMTREKRSEHGYKIVGHDTASAGFRKLQLIASQVKGDADIIRLIDTIGLTRSDTLLSPISGLLTTVVGGTVGHRYASRLGHLGAFLLGCFSLASNLVISSDNAGCLSGGLVDYPVMIQEYFLTLTGLLHLRLLADPSRVVDIGTICIGNTPLQEADIRPAAFEGEFALSPFRLPNNHLAFRKTLDLHHNRSLFASAEFAAYALRGTLKRSPSIAREVIVAWVRAILRTNGRARAIADSAPLATGRLFASLDLAETVALGYSRLVYAMGVAIAEEGIYNLWRSAHHKEIRWRLRPFIWKLAEALSVVACEHLGHPLLSEDKLCVENGLFSTPRYTGGRSQVQLRMTGLLAAAAEKQIRNRNSYLYNQRMAVFASDTELGASEVTYKALCVCLHRGWQNGTLSKTDVSWLMTSYIMPLGSSKDSEEARVVEARALAYGISGWAKTRGLNDLSSDLEVLGSGKKLVLYPVAVEEALRDMRRGHEWGLSVLHRKSVRAYRKTIKQPVCKTTWFTHPRLLRNEWRCLDAPSIRQHDVAHAQLEAARGRVYGTHSSAHYSFISLLARVENRDVLVVGSGHGAVARLCLEGGARSVFGLDLASSLPLEGHNFRWYKPPMVQESEYAERYVQLPESFITSGDWYDPSVSSSVLTSLLTSALVVIDIQAGASRQGLECLDPLIESQWTGLVVVRLYITIEEAELLVSDISAGGGRVEIYSGAPERPRHMTQMVVLHFLSLPQQPCTAVSRCMALKWVSSDPPDLHYMGGGSAFLLGLSVFSMVPVSDRDTPSSVRERIVHVISVSHGEYLSRPSYAHWTLMLHALLSCDFLLASPSHRVYMLDTLLSGSSLPLSAGSLRLSIEPSPRLVRHLCKVVGRLL